MQHKHIHATCNSLNKHIPSFPSKPCNPPIDPLAFRDSGDLIASLLSSLSSCTHHSTVSPPLASFSSTQEAQACLSITPPAFDAVLLIFCSTFLYALLNILVSFCPRLFIAPFFILLPLSWWQKAVLVSSRCPQFPGSIICLCNSVSLFILDAGFLLVSLVSVLCCSLSCVSLSRLLPSSVHLNATLLQAFSF